MYLGKFAIIFWSLAAALPRAKRIVDWTTQRWAGKGIDNDQRLAFVLRNLLWTTTLTSGFFFSLSPLGMPFWDAGSSWHWRMLYGSTQRAAMFARIEHLIPKTARVASTDFVHPRFTHYERSYDYSDYYRKTSGHGNRMPKDSDYLVIDTQHKYSKIKRPDEIPEYRDHPDDWEVMPDQTEGYFIVLRRKNSSDK